MLRLTILQTFYRQSKTATEAQSLQHAVRSLYNSTSLSAAHVSADHKKVSTPDDGDIGRGAHQAAPVSEGDPSDVVPNLVKPDESSGKAAQGTQEVKGFKSASPGTPELATQTTAKPGQEREEVATSPTPSMAPSSKIAPNKSIGTSWSPRSAFKQSRFLHSMSAGYKEDLGVREEKLMPAVGIAASGAGY